MQTAVTASSEAPHWDTLLADVDPRSLLALISTWMGRQLESCVSAEDVLQETFCVAWRDREGYRQEEDGSFRAWLLRIARNRICDLSRYYARHKRGGAERVVELSALQRHAGRAAADHLPVESETPSAILSKLERSQVLLRTLEALPECKREVLRLYLIEGLPMRQVSERLGIGVSAAWHRFRNALASYRLRVAGQARDVFDVG